MKKIVLIFVLISIFSLQSEAKPLHDNDKDNDKGPHMEVIRVDGHGRALVIIVPKNKENAAKHDLKAIDGNENLHIEKTEDGLKLYKGDHEFDVDTEHGHQKGKNGN